MPCARCAVQSSTGKYSAQDLQYKVVLWGTVWTACSIYKVVLRGVLDVSSKSVQEECLTRVFQSIERECFTRVCHKSVRQECLTRVSHKSVPQECPTRVCHESVTKDCPTRLSEKSVKEECSARVAFNAIQHLLFAFHCSVGTLLLRELWKNAFRFVASIRFFFTTGQNDVARASTSFMFSSRSQVLMHRCQFSRVSSSFICLYLDVVAVVSLLAV